MKEGYVDVVIEKAQRKIIEKEIKIIEKYYPGSDNLLPMEKTLRGAYQSFHAFQHIIALYRKGDADIFIDESGDLCVTKNE